MKRYFLQSIIFCTLPFISTGFGVAGEIKKETRPEVEVVFCLDTTGSMGGLINAAKQKIWAICNQISTGKPTPLVKVGLVAYRDRKDAYVTQVFDLTEDLDAMHGNLMGLQAKGGGDFPESVNQALNEAVTKIKWSENKKTLKMIFLVGDAPPHMDYADDVKYPETCKLAVKNDIIINTVQCGIHHETKKYWEEICRLAEGSYVQIDAQGGPIVAIATPFDKDLAEINGDLAKTTVVFGTSEDQKSGENKAAANLTLSAPAAADRAAYFSRQAEKGGTSYDLITNINNGKVKLHELKKEHLPPVLQNKTLEVQKSILKDLENRRVELSQKALDLDKKRREFISQKQSETGKNSPLNSFDNQVLNLLQQQARRQNVIEYQIENPNKK